MTVEIIGYACVAPGASSAAELFQQLHAGTCSVTEVSERWDKARYWHPTQGTSGKTYTFAAGVVSDVNSFDCTVFGLSRREAMAMDPQQRLLLSVTWRALEDASLPLSSLRDESVGVYVGASGLDNANLYAEDPASGGPYFMTGNTLSIVANRISHIFGLAGPSLTIDTACSSSLVALDQAVRALEHGEIDTAIVGGVNVLSHPLPFVGFAQARMLSPEGRCRAYDNDASGYVRAEGAATVILRRTETAEAAGDRSHARIVATGVNSSGRTNGISLPSAEAQVALLRRIYDDARIDPNQIAFIEGHGTGTKVGDPAEVFAIGQIIGKRRHAPVPLGSIKTNIGHTEPASGLFGLLKAVMALENNYFPASLFFDTPNEAIDFAGLNVHVASTALDLIRSRRPRLAGVNSFGFGGTNAHVVIADPDPARTPVVDKGADRYFVASAHTASALKRLVADYRDTLRGAKAEKADQIVAASASGRTLLRHRLVVHARRGKDAENALTAFLSGGAGHAVEVGETPAGDAKIAFVFSGNGAQWAGMGLDAYRLNPSFRRHLDAASALFEAHLGEKVVDLLKAVDLAMRLSDARIAQPLLFAIQVSFANCLLEAGIRPAHVLGHSIGEVAAAHIAGAVSLIDAIAIVAARSLCQHAMQGRGTMAAALCSEEQAKAFLLQNGFKDVVVAAVNARNSVTFSGPGESIAALRALGRQRKIAIQPLDIDYPFHHPLMDDVKQDFLMALPNISLHNCEFGFLSTVSGGSMQGKQLNSHYWWRNAREPVVFRQAVAAALDLGCNLLIEIAPRAILTNYLKETVREFAANAQVINTLTLEPRAAFDPVARSVARAFAHGADGLVGERNPAVALPVLPFEPEVLTVPATSDSYDMFGRHAAPYSLAGWRIDPNGTAWKNHIDAALLPDLAEHVVEGRAIMPGSGLVEIALQVASQFLGTQHVSLTNMELLHPLPLDAKMLEMSTTISPETGVIEIRSRERLSTDDWTLHAVARCQKGTNPQTVQGFKPLTGTPISIGRDKVYGVAADFGLHYGPAFQLLASAESDGDNRIDVTLHPSATPAHALLTWLISPMSLDAAFHGLVGLFDRLSGQSDGAPYIPVRFGAIDLVQPGAAIRRAAIEIQRFSRHSIKARFVLQDGDGNTGLRIEDCRFRRTWLRQHASLASLGFHYESLPWSGAEIAAHPIPGRLLDIPADQTLDDSSLLLQAAIYRASHDIVAPLTDEKGTVDLGRLAKGQALRSFILSCLNILAEAGLADRQGASWTVKSDHDFPSVSELLQEMQAERPDRGVEVVMVAAIRAGILKRLRHPNAAGADPLMPARPRLEHFRLHSANAWWRNELLLCAVRRVIADAPDRPLNVLLIGAGASAFNTQLSEMVARCNGRLVIYEPDEDLRRSLEMTFEDSARVIVTDHLRSDCAHHFVISAGDRLHRSLETDERLAAAVGAAMTAGARLLAVESLVSSVSDFLFGLSRDGATDGLVEGMQIGPLATEWEWRQMLTRMGFADGGLIACDGPYGPAVLLDVQGKPASQKHHDLRADAVVLGAPWAGPSTSNILSFDLETDVIRQDLGRFLPRQDPTRPLTFLYHRPAADGDRSDMLTRESWKLARFANALQSLLASAKNLPPIELVLMLPGGGPVRRVDAAATIDPVSSGLWSFARVLANELDGVAVHRVDAEARDWRRVVEIIRSGDANREWRLTDEGKHVDVVRVVGGPLSTPGSNTRDFGAATIRQRLPSRVDTLYWEATDPVTVKDDAVLVEVAAAGLNFRDVMWAMGLLPEEALEDGFAGATIGMELSGKVVAVGANVDDLAVGDAVMGIGPAAFSTHAAISRSGLARIPAGLGLTAAATVPVAFLTAWYAIVELGQARAGETILIHGAAGGVGLAAIQIAQYLGLSVIATVGSEEKKAYLDMLGVEHIFNSRSLSFVDDVKRVTEGQGVDLVLNSLFSDAMESSIGLLRPFGRFLELGKRDYYADRKIGLRPFRRNISYFGIDADQLPLKAPDLTGQIFEQLGRLFLAGTLVPLPYRCFRHSEIADAFRLMQNSGQIGKIVIVPPKIGDDEVARKPAQAPPLDADGIHIVIGGIGGFGLAAAEWLVSRGARRLALVTRRGAPDDETGMAFLHWAELGVTATLHACDVTDGQMVEQLLASLRRQAPIRGIIHAAMVLDDALLVNLTEPRFKSVIAVKAQGAVNLDRASREDRLDYFLLFSSVTTMIGNPGQANYVAANGFLEGLARSRRAEGLPALAVGFGAISDRGYLAGNQDTSEILSRRLGKTSIKASTALAFVEAYMAQDPGTPDAATVMCTSMDWSVASNLAIVATPMFEVPLRKMTTVAATGSDGIDLAALIANQSEAGALDLLYKVVATEIASVLRVSESTLSRGKVLRDAGLDSLMAVELGLSFKERTGVEIPLANLGDTTTIDNVVQKLYDRVKRAAVQGDVDEEASNDIDAMAGRHIDLSLNAAGQS